MIGVDKIEDIRKRVRGDLVYPVAEHLAALGVAERPHRPCQALAVLEVVLDGAVDVQLKLRRIRIAI